MKKRNHFSHDVLAEGLISVTASNWQETIRPWGNPDGFVITGCPIDPVTGAKRSRVVTMMLFCDSAEIPWLESLTTAIPSEILDFVRRFPAFATEHLELASSNPAGWIRLSKANPVLLQMIARRFAETDGLFDLDLNDSEEWLLLRMRLASSWAPILRKVESPELWTSRDLELLLEALKLVGGEALLSSLPRVTLDGVLLILTDRWYASSYPRIFRSSGRVGAPTVPAVYLALDTIRAASVAQGESFDWASMSEHLSSFAEEMSKFAEVIGVTPHRPYPECDFGVPPGWKQVTDYHTLMRLENAFGLNLSAWHPFLGNCGTVMLYAVEPASIIQVGTIVVFEWYDGNWRLDSVMAPYGSPLSKRLDAKIRKLLQRV
jgi:hypothetical protein